LYKQTKSRPCFESLAHHFFKHPCSAIGYTFALPVVVVGGGVFVVLVSGGVAIYLKL